MKKVREKKCVHRREKEERGENKTEKAWVMWRSLIGPLVS